MRFESLNEAIKHPFPSQLRSLDHMKDVLTFLFILAGASVFSQSLLLQPDFRQKMEFRYENDLFARTDRYYSQGIFLNYAHKSEIEAEFRSMPVDAYFNCGLIHQVYTPSTIKSDSALYNDRPYAATLSFYADRTLIDKAGKFSISSGIEMGGVGPFAFGKQMQTGIHQATNNFLPLGWQYQISNGFILDVLLKSEFQLVSNNWFQLNAGMDLEFGTFRNNLKPAILIGLGAMKVKRNFFYSKSSLALIGYDGTLQGSLIGEKSPVTVSGNDLERAVFLQEFGLKLGFERLQFGLNYSIQSKTFSKQLSAFHSWGGITAVYCF